MSTTTTMMMRPLPFCILLLPALVAMVYGFSPASYDHNVLLSDKGYSLYWSVDEPLDQIRLALQVNTTGYIGFGIGDPTSGSMPGADVSLSYVINGVASVEDRYTVGFTTPVLDDCQDWVLVSGEEANGVTTVELTRQLTANDPIQDRAIPPGTTNIIWSFGTSDRLAYHGNNRGFTSVVFYGEDPDLPLLGDEYKSVDLLLNNASLPAESTVYMTQGFVLPFEAEGPAHVIRIDPIIDKRNLNYVHHFFAYSCSTYEKIATYMTNPVQYGGVGCDMLVYGWGVGGNSLILPQEAGILMNASVNGIKYLMLQIHYNNPTLVPGIVDHSGIRLTWTRTLRRHHAGMTLLGDVTLRSGAIPAGQKSVHREFTCPGQCTSQWTHDITVFGDWFHMHHIGSMGWGTLYDSQNVSKGYTSRSEYFAFDKQHISKVNYTINRGDRIHSHCVWDSTSRTQPTDMGESSDEEMCFHIIFYYPALYMPDGTSFEFCGLFPSPRPTVCGKSPNVMALPQPLVPEPPGGMNKTFGQHVAPSACQQTETTTLASAVSSSSASTSVTTSSSLDSPSSSSSSSPSSATASTTTGGPSMISGTSRLSASMMAVTILVAVAVM
eukprot:TRINITY_DN519_c0_g1_i1.p1 TRINITY_DN519_c0_g1~~TRINITY_DN519_c0_g1_i1.p1  ORF type:complete len:607 (+),score=152.87 TRINITY_DN519_c0_g1_i1:1805-3625(+)